MLSLGRQGRREYAVFFWVSQGPDFKCFVDYVLCYFYSFASQLSSPEVYKQHVLENIEAYVFITRQGLSALWLWTTYSAFCTSCGVRLRVVPCPGVVLRTRAVHI